MSPRAEQERLVEEALRNLVGQYGAERVRDPETVRALLADELGARSVETRRETNLLAGVAGYGTDRVFREGRAPAPDVVDTMATDLGLDRDGVRWATAAWAGALGHERAARSDTGGGAATVPDGGSAGGGTGELVPPAARKPWVLVAAVVAAVALIGLVAALVTTGDDDVAAPTTTSTPTTIGEPVTGPGVLEGVRGTLAGTVTRVSFEDRLVAVRPETEGFTEYAAEAYDAVVITALAAAMAGTDQAPAIARQINGVTRGDNLCTTFSSCVDDAEAGIDIAYYGPSGAAEFTRAGEPGVAEMRAVEFGADNRIDPDRTEVITVTDPHLDAGDADPSCRGRSDGRLVLGTLVPETGPLRFYEGPINGGVELALEDINDAGGVLGGAVEVIFADSGPPGGTELMDAVDDLLAAGVDAIIGPTTSREALLVLDRVVDACVILFSASNSSGELSEVDDDDLYFRTAAADNLHAEMLADMVVADGHGSIAVIAVDEDYMNARRERLVEALDARGVDVIEVTYDEAPDDRDLDQSLATDPAAVALLGYDETVEALQGLLRRGSTPDQKGIYLIDTNLHALGTDFD